MRWQEAGNKASGASDPELQICCSNESAQYFIAFSSRQVKASSIAWKCLSALGNRSFTQLADCNIVDLVQADRRGRSAIEPSFVEEFSQERRENFGLKPVIIDFPRTGAGK